MHFQAGSHFVRDDGTVNHAFGQGFGHLRHGHAHGGGPHHAQHFGDGGGGAAHFQALQVFHLGDGLVLGEEHAGAMHMDGQQLHILVFILGVLLGKVPGGAAGGRCVGHHEGQLKHLAACKAASGVARHRPHHIGHTVFGLVKQLWRRATQLHGGVDLAGQAVARIFGDVVTPGLHHFGVLNRLWPQEVMHLEGDGFGLCRSQRAKQPSCQCGVFEEVLHGLSPVMVWLNMNYFTYYPPAGNGVYPKTES